MRKLSFEAHPHNEPLVCSSEYGIFKRVREGAFTFPAGFPAVPKDFVSNLLVLNVRERLGSAARGGIAGIKRHPFFDTIKWDDLLSTVRLHLPDVPYVCMHPGATSYHAILAGVRRRTGTSFNNTHLRR
jgi:hypothetical protein